MKLQVGNFVKVIGGNALNLYEIIAIRQYEDTGKPPVIMAVIWGVNNAEAGAVEITKLKSTKPYWSADEKLPFAALDEFDTTPPVTPVVVEGTA